MKIAGGVRLIFRGSILLGFFLTVLPLRPVFAQQALPTGWRKPKPAEATGAWRRKSATKFLVVRGDFDGDGQSDVAELLVDDSGRHFSLFVWLSSRRDWQSVHGGGAPLGNLGIDIVHPRKFDTLCHDDPSVCAPGAPTTVDLKNDAIEFFAWGETSSIFYWDPSANTFRNAPMSD